MGKGSIKLVAESLKLWIARRGLIMIAEMVNHEKTCIEHTVQNVEHGISRT